MPICFHQEAFFQARRTLSINALKPYILLLCAPTWQQQLQEGLVLGSKTYTYRISSLPYLLQLVLVLSVCDTAHCVVSKEQLMLRFAPRLEEAGDLFAVSRFALAVQPPRGNHFCWPDLFPRGKRPLAYMAPVDAFRSFTFSR